jgi:shikimate 5-dehydrogenase
LKREGADVTLLVRDPQKASALADEFDVAVEELTNAVEPLATDILVNATPLGTRGSAENETIATADAMLGVKLVYDLVYNPIETRLLREAKLAGARTVGGLDMLIAQGAKQFEIWSGQAAPLETMRRSIEGRLR